RQEASSTFVLVGSAIAFGIFVIILVLVFGVGIRAVKKGFKCTYSANDETFTTTIGGDLHVIRYEEVSSVHFEPRNAFGKVRGYDITIRVKGVDQKFSVCSDGYISPQATPFFIVQERVEILRQKRTAAPTFINTARADNKAISRAEIDKANGGGVSALDRMSQLLGETSNMPELSADNSPTSQAIARVNALLNASDSGGMPTIGESARPVNTYVGTDGREFPIEQTQTQGTFYVKPTPLKLIIFSVISTAIVVGVLVGAIFLLGKSVVGLLLVPFAWAIPIVFVLALFFTLYTCVTKVHGDLYEYRADGRGFFITIKGKGGEQILYKDVLSVDYKHTKLFGRSYGYKVDILTSYGIVHYDYIYPRFGHKVPRQYLPFECIRKNMPNKDVEETY
ncbi:MAG: hypothetical protein K2J77_09895, partial [Oscillospiraceae bacterium]|nr:hypothetical protein [Oscillospiraceae bacterium]